MRITRDQAHHAANKLVEKKQKAYEKRMEDFRAKIQKLYLKNIPKAILDLSKKHKEFFSFESFIKLGSRFGYAGISTINREYLIHKCQNDDIIPNLEGKEIDDLVREFFSINEEKQSIKNLRADTAEAIYQLKTMKKLEESFPEAVPHIPPKQTTELAIRDYGKLRNRLK